MSVPKDLPGIRTQTDHLQGDLGVLVLVVYLKPEAENTRNIKLPLLLKVHEIWSVDSLQNNYNCCQQMTDFKFLML